MKQIELLNIDQEITVDYFKYHLNYDPDTGIIKAMTNVNKNRLIGYEIRLKHNAYLAITLHGKKYLAHRIAWIMHYGHWPINYIDHINGDGSDNRIVNLRDVTACVNLYNSHKHRYNRFVGIRKYRSGYRINLPNQKTGHARTKRAALRIRRKAMKAAGLNKIVRSA